VDASEGVSAQDTHVAGYALESGKACVIVLNKWDAVADRENYGDHIKRVREEFKFLKWAPVVTISARTGQRASKLWSLVRHCNAQHTRQFPTSELNRILRMATSYVSPPIGKGRQLKLKYVTQTGSRPPQFTFFVNDPEIVHFSYERYLENQFRAALDLDGTPLQLKFRRKADDWVEKKLEDAKQSGAAGTSGALRKPRVINIGEDEDYEAEVFDEDGSEEEGEEGGEE
jgi:GTP-binding protein